MNVPYDGLTTAAALTHSGSTCASDPKTHPQAVCMLLPPSLETDHPLTVDRLDSAPLPVAIFPIALCSPSVSTPRRVSSPLNLEHPSSSHNKLRELRCLSFAHRPGGPGKRSPRHCIRCVPSCRAASEVAPSRFVNKHTDDGGPDLRKRLSAGLLQDLPHPLPIARRLMR
jgi:hypothetical protein